MPNRKSDLAALLDDPAGRRRFLAFAGKVLRHLSWRGLPVPDIFVETKTFWGASLGKLNLKDVDTVDLLGDGQPSGPEKKLTRYFIENLGSEDVFYDIGANNGFYSALAIHSRCKEIHAFEPIKDNYDRLSELWKAEKDVIVNREAVSDSVGRLEFYDSSIGLHSGGSTTVKNVADLRGKEFKIMQVLSTTIDKYVADGNLPPTVLKIDVEGAEINVLRGAMETLKQHRPKIAVEVWGGEKATEYTGPVANLLGELGYRGYLLTDTGQTAPITDGKFWMSIEDYANIIFLP